MSDKKSDTAKQARKPAFTVRKLSDEEIVVFLVVLSALMAEVPAPKDARKSYLTEVEKRLRNNGVDFISKSRVFPIYGLKLLGKDSTGFPIPGFKQAAGKKYPKLFAWYWAELERLSLLTKPELSDARRAQRVLCVLSFAKMIKVSSVNQIKKSLGSFELRVAKPENDAQDANVSSEKNKDEGSSADEEQHQHFSSLPSLTDLLGYKGDLNLLPNYVDFDSISTKPSALRDRPALPEWFAGQFMKVTRHSDGRTEVYVPTIGLKPPPYGKIHVITEAAGKLRIICPYNTPFVHSTGLFARAREVLSTLKGDCSTDQSVGHRLIQKLTANSHLIQEGDSIISADLDAFSDNTSAPAICFGLRGLGLSGLEDYLLNLPVSNCLGQIFVPKRLLMGLKGCFELSSVLHHCAVNSANIIRYALCGDDLAYVGRLEPYERAIKQFGWTLNRSKTVVSPTAAVFCGEMYWLGYRISPCVPKLHTVFKNNGKLHKASVIFSVLRSTIENLNAIYNRRAVARICGPLITLLRRVWKGIIVPSLPVELRGLGMRPAKTQKLLKILQPKAVLRMCILSIGIERDIGAQNRWFGLPVELTPSSIQRELPSFPALLSSGAVSLQAPKPPRKVVKGVGSLDLYDVLEWYYNGQRLGIEKFQSDAPLG